MAKLVQTRTRKDLILAEDGIAAPNTTVIGTVMAYTIDIYVRGGNDCRLILSRAEMFNIVARWMEITGREEIHRLQERERA